MCYINKFDFTALEIDNNKNHSRKFMYEKLHLPKLVVLRLVLNKGIAMSLYLMCHCFLTLSQLTTVWKRLWHLFFKLRNFPPEKPHWLCHSQVISAPWWALLSVSCCCGLLIIAWGAAGGVMQQVHSGFSAANVPNTRELGSKCLTITQTRLFVWGGAVFVWCLAPRHLRTRRQRGNGRPQSILCVDRWRLMTMMFCRLLLTLDQLFEYRPTEKQSRQVGVLL